MKTLKVDERQRVRIPGVKPGQVFAYERGPDDRIILTPIAATEERPPAKVRFVKVNGRTVGITDRPFDMESLKQALAEFP